MGHGASRRKKERDLRLPTTGLVLTPSQLCFLNYHFTEQLANLSGELRCEPSLTTTTAALVERLMQRLLCGVGSLDHRFSSKFLINLDPTRASSKAGCQSFSYLVRLDMLSSPLLYPEHQEQPTCQVVQTDGGPQGFAKVRPTGCKVEDWAEFINHHGFLRRDKLQERFVELLAQSAGRSSVPGEPGQIDESRLCGCPGKVVDPGVAFHLITLPPQEQFYFGAAECHRHSFPDPREFRLAIVEGTPCVRLRVGLLPPLNFSTSEEDVQVTLTLGIGFTGWPHNCDFPGRVSLAHLDILLYQQAATMGFYLVPAPPHPTTRCDDRSATWQFRFPATECALLTHYAAQSTPSRVLAVLRSLLADIRRTTNGGQVISDYMLKTFLWFRLEEDHESLIATLRSWDHDKLSTHVLVILDRLVSALRTQRQRSYWFPWFNVMLSAPGGGTLHYSEEDYCDDAELVAGLLCRLGEFSQQPPPTLQGLEAWQQLDSRLVGRWQDVLYSLAPPPPAYTRSRRLRSGYGTQYSPRQLEYVKHVLRGMLAVRALTLYQDHQFPNLFNQNTDPHLTPHDTSEYSEDLIYLLTSIIDQAKALHSARKGQETRLKRTKSHSVPKRDSIRSGRKTDCYEAAVRRLTEEMRAATATDSVTETDDTALVRSVLRWLYHGLDTDRRHLAPVLRPYLNRIFAISHECCWHVDEWRKRQDNQELFALGRFSKLVVEDGLSPREGIADAIQKGWQWAEQVVEAASQFSEGVELVFAPSPGRVLRYRVRLHKSASLSTRSLGRNLSLSKMDDRPNFATLPRHVNGIKDLMKARADHVELSDSAHCRLRVANPIVNAIDSQRRYGTHRGVGSIVEALVTLNKFSVLQEVSNLLPEDERAQVLDDIQRVSKERRRYRRAHAPPGQPTQLYRPVAEFTQNTPTESEYCGGKDNRQWLASVSVSTTKSLLGTCREARQRQGQLPVFERLLFEPSPAAPLNPLSQPLLCMTSDNRLAFTTETTRHAPIVRAMHKKEMVTKL